MKPKTTDDRQLPYVNQEPAYVKLTADIQNARETIKDLEQRRHNLYEGPYQAKKQASADDVRDAMLQGQDVGAVAIESRDSEAERLTIRIRGAKKALESFEQKRNMFVGRAVPEICKRPDVIKESRRLEHESLSLMIDLYDALKAKDARYCAMDSHGLVATYRPAELHTLPFEHWILAGTPGHESMLNFVRHRAQVWGFDDITKRVEKLK